MTMPLFEAPMPEAKPLVKARPYQTEAIKAIHKSLKSVNSTLMVMATGLGKTIAFSMLALDFLPRGRVMVLAHREELIFQAYQKLTDVTGIEPAIEMGDYHVQDDREIVVSSIQTQIAGMDGDGRMTKFNPHEFGLIIIDEAHHSRAKSYHRVIDYYRQNPNAKVLGVTATPDRADEKALGKVFEDVAYEYDIRDGINDGWLAEIRQSEVVVEGLDFSKIRNAKSGDLHGAELAAVLEQEQALHEIATPTVELVGDRKALVFAASVAQAERLTEIINRHKPDSADFVTGTTDKVERREMFAAFARKDFQFLVNVGVATEGFDDPSIDCIVMARPTKSRSLYAQMAGRGTRPLPGIIDGLELPQSRKEAMRNSDKPFVEIIDFVGNSGEHKLITSADVLGGNYDDTVIERAKRNAEEKDVPTDVLDELELAEKQIEAEQREERERAARERIRAKVKYSTAKVNPFDVLDVNPWREKGWHKGRQPTQKQLKTLENAGVPTDGLSFTHASQLIDQVFKRRKNGTCTYKQAKVLNKFGYHNSKDFTFKQASDLISQIADNGWRRPN